MNYQFAKMLDGTTWAMRPASFVKMLERAITATPQEVRAAVAAYGPSSQGPKMFGDVAVIDVCGPITYESSWFSMYFGGSSIKDMQAKLQTSMADPAVKTIVFRWDSPGGCCEMVPEFADELFAASKKGGGSKVILSVADTMIASAAYWLASQTDTIYTPPASGRIGAIGVYTEHDDISGMLEKAGIKVTLIAHGAHKVDGNPYEPLSDAVKADIQADVDAVGDLFDSAVARGRQVSKPVVLDRFGQGDVFTGREAISLGMADKQGAFSQVLAKLTKSAANARPLRVAVAAPGVIQAKSKKADGPEDTIDPVNGECEDGYELGDDGLCHLTLPDDDEEAKANAAIAEQDALAIAAVLGEVQ